MWLRIWDALHNIPSHGFAIGQIGSGASVVTRAMAGLVENATGEMRLSGRRLPLGSVSTCVGNNVLFLSEDRAAEGLFHQMRVLDNLVASSLSRHARFGVTARAAGRPIGGGSTDYCVSHQRFELPHALREGDAPCPAGFVKQRFATVVPRRFADPDAEHQTYRFDFNP